MSEQQDDDEYEEYYTFVDCICEHGSSEHGWQYCDVPGCICEGHWEE